MLPERLSFKYKNMCTLKESTYIAPGPVDLDEILGEKHFFFFPFLNMDNVTG